MKAKTSNLTRMAVTAVSILFLGASAFAGPMPMFIMFHGQMMRVLPMTKDMTLKNGCKVCMNGAVISSTGTKMMVKDGDMVSAEGAVMPPVRPFETRPRRIVG